MVSTDASLAGSAALHDNDAGIVTLTKIGGAFFDLTSIDLSDLFHATLGVSVTFTRV